METLMGFVLGMLVTGWTIALMQSDRKIDFDKIAYAKAQCVEGVKSVDAYTKDFECIGGLKGTYIKGSK
jgi:hypothetical protein